MQLIRIVVICQRLTLVRQTLRKQAFGAGKQNLANHRPRRTVIPGFDAAPSAVARHPASLRAKRSNPALRAKALDCFGALRLAMAIQTDANGR